MEIAEGQGAENRVKSKIRGPGSQPTLTKSTYVRLYDRVGGHTGQDVPDIHAKHLRIPAQTRQRSNGHCSMC